MNQPRILVAGLGNIFHGDDGFGSELARRLLCGPQRPEVRIIDFGTRGRDLAYALLEPIDAVIFLDAVKQGDPPGTVSLLEPDFETDNLDLESECISSPHGFHLTQLPGLLRALEAKLPSSLLIGCEPAEVDPDVEGAVGLSDPVRDAMDRAVELAESVLARLAFDSGTENHA